MGAKKANSDVLAIKKKPKTESICKNRGKKRKRGDQNLLLIGRGEKGEVSV